ncbi:MAG: SGNH/GDSL hydrolase family protein [Candidatus Omnitrophica bacterium]|nr:SGNH/GDSL hydrolase family protein [Candidatus Omnitrophota bacterium]
MKQVRVERLLSKLAKGEQVTIVTLGDSNTELTFHTRGCLNWVGLLQEALFEKYGANRVIMINAGCCGEIASGGLMRLDRDVIRFNPDLVIICYWDGDMGPLKKIVQGIQSSTKAEVLLRTPNPIVATNQPQTTPAVVCGKEWPGSDKGEAAKKIVALGKELNIPVVDHYKSWMEADAFHDGPPVSNPNKLWLRMSDAFHPGPLGHIAFYRDLAPFFGLPVKLST